MPFLAAVALASALSTYTTQCSSCHGAQGQGTRTGSPLVGVNATTVHFMLDTGRMPAAVPGQEQPHAAPRLSPAQIDALAQYVAAFAHPPKTQLPQTTPGDPVRGAALFRANCTACHGATGGGGAIGGGTYPVAPSLAAASTFQVAEAIRAGPGEMPRFGPGVLSDAEVADIASYVTGIARAPQPGGITLEGIGPVAEGFVAVVFGLGLLLILIRALNPPRSSPTSDDR